MIAGQLDHVTKKFGGQIVLDDVSLTVHGAEVLGLVGPNGAGKTTMLRILAGLLRASRGEVSRGGGGPTSIRYFAGEQTLPPDVPTRRWLSLWTNARSAPAKRLGLLSRGTRQRIGLEAMLSGDPITLLLLDEPWEGLDPDASLWLSQTLARKRTSGTGIMISSHRIHDLAEACDRCAFLVEGRISAEVVDWARTPDARCRSAVLLDRFARARAQR